MGAARIIFPGTATVHIGYSRITIEKAGAPVIIDFHCHILPPQFRGRHHELAARDATYAALFPGQRGRSADVDTLLRDMDESGIDHAVVMGFGWTVQGIAKTANNYLVGASKAHPDRISAFASVSPAWGDAAVIEAHRCLGAGAVGLGELHADTQGYDIADRDVMEPIMTLLRDVELPVTVHASEPVGHLYPGKGKTTPDKLLRFASNFPDNRIVLAHLGGGLPFYEAMPEVGVALSNVRYDTAALPYLYRPSAITAAVATGGADAILFGTDYPLLTHRRVLEHVQSAGLTSVEIEAILGSNAVSLLFEPKHD